MHKFPSLFVEINPGFSLHNLIQKSTLYLTQYMN